MTGRAAVAVLTATHDQAAFIGPCIESVLAQTREDWEMVIVDDASTDGTAEIARRYRDGRISVIENRARRGLGGLGHTYRVALEATRAPLVAVLEGDDLWPASKLEMQVPQFDDPDVVLAYGAAGLIDERGCRYATYRRRPGRRAVAENRPTGAILGELLFHNFIVAVTVVVRRAALLRAGGFWQPVGVPYLDHPTWLRLALEGRFGWSEDVVGYWRRHPRQWTTATAEEEQPPRRGYLAEFAGLARSRAVELHTGGIPETELDHSLWAALNRQRLALLHGSVREAAEASVSLARTGKPKLAALAAIGLTSRILGSDLEWVFRSTQRLSWPSRRHLNSGAHRRNRDPG